MHLAAHAVCVGHTCLHVRLEFPSFDFDVSQQRQKRAQNLLCCSTNALLELGLLGLCLSLVQLQQKALPSTCLCASSSES